MRAVLDPRVQEHLVHGLPLADHVRIAQWHAQRALNLAYGDEPQPFRVRLAIGKAQSLLISLIANGRLRPPEEPAPPAQPMFPSQMRDDPGEQRR